MLLEFIRIAGNRATEFAYYLKRTLCAMTIIAVFEIMRIARYQK